MNPTDYVKSRIEVSQKADLKIYSFIAEYLESEGYKISSLSVKESSDKGFGRQIDIRINSLEREVGGSIIGWPYYSSLSEKRS